MGVINPEVADKPMDTSTRSMRHSAAIGMRMWKMWREAESRVSVVLSLWLSLSFNLFLCKLIVLRP